MYIPTNKHVLFILATASERVASKDEVKMLHRVAYLGGEPFLRGPEGRIWPDDF